MGAVPYYFGVSRNNATVPFDTANGYRFRDVAGVVGWYGQKAQI